MLLRLEHLLMFEFCEKGGKFALTESVDHIKTPTNAKRRINRREAKRGETAAHGGSCVETSEEEKEASALCGSGG